MVVECRLPLLRPDFDATHRAGFLFLFATQVIVPLVLVFLLVQLSHAHAVPLGIAGLCIALLILKPLFRKLMRDYAKTNDHDGWITLLPTEVRIERNGSTRTIPLRAGTAIALDNHYIQGKPRGPKDFLRNGVATLNISGDGASITLLFVVRDRKDWKALREVLKEWYRNKAVIKEKADELMSGVFLLDGNWSYEKLQRTKAELGVA